ncbi:MAG: trypsin-like peptidase domain-containing protein [Pseudobacter sp.]|uniref:trypsin-like peptidase domain-containing protein n=1 Tax=Pseudobacter sp. TaxID=2045420 RepID=UPI003F82139F
MRFNQISFFFTAGLLLTASCLFSQQPDFKSLESDIQRVVKRVSRATVSITNYDSVQDRETGATFTGVVVSGDGIILSAAHAVKTNQTYKINFPDGRTAVAKGLGSFDNNDAAVLKIIRQGTWPYAEMGWSCTLNTYEPCLSLGYPQNMRQSGPPLVRLGYIIESNENPGFLCNTALMEPGDSGGPLFDMNGKVIGIHSRIAQSANANFEIPVDEFRKNWEKLLNTGEYQFSSPMKSVDLLTTPVESGIKPIPSLAKIDESLSLLSSGFQATTLAITSLLNKTAVDALGTVLFLSNEDLKNYSYIISKSSIVGDSISVAHDSKSYPAIVVARDSMNDLVLLKINTSIKEGIKILSGIGSINNYMAGTILFSPIAGNKPAKVSVLSSPGISYLPNRWNTTVRIKVIEQNNLLRVQSVEANSSAKISKVKAGDRIVSLNGVKVSTRDEFNWEIATYKPFAKIRLKGKRYGFGYTKNLVLEDMGNTQPAQEHLAEHFEGGKSERRYGFRRMFSHDGRLLPAECGSPVFDLDGNFLGINIARVSRTSSIAIPAEEVRAFVQSALNMSAGK